VFAVAICILLFPAAAAFAQQAGSIRGMVFDKDFDMPLAAAEVSIAETGAKVTASDEGNYLFSQVEPGRYTLVFSKEGYTRQVVANVVVSPGQMTDVNSSLTGEFTDMEEFVVQDFEIGGNSEAGLLNLRLESPAMMDSISADLMSRAGASDAAGALKLVTGASVQDDKYPVVRGLPDRYVNSQMNNVRLPSADPDKRAVQLDQFPSELIESIQVSKTFTPDQQGDASGGAVNVVLKGIPEESILKFKIGTKYKTNVNGEDFLSYKDGGVDYWGKDDGGRDEQTQGIPWKGAVGVEKDDAPFMYDWQLTAGGKHELSDGVKVGGLANFYYKQDASSYDDGIDDKYLMTRSGDMVPLRGGGDDYTTSLFDTQQSTDEVQWGGLGVLGLETERNQLKLLYMRTQVAEDKATLAEDTRGKEDGFPGYDPYDLDDPGNTQDNALVAPYLRNQTLEYTERKTETLQLSGKHTVPFPEIRIPKVITFLEPEIDWTVSKNSSELYRPDKRMFGSAWIPAYIIPGNPRWGIPASTNAPHYQPNKPEANYTMGNLQRIWKEVTDEDDQISLNGKLPFEQWSGDSGFFKIGYFKDKVDREYWQESYSNLRDQSMDSGDWDDPWSDSFPEQDYHPMYAADIDVDYDGEQEIEAWYYMLNVPLSSYFKIIGGTRYESTDMSISLDPEPGATWVNPETRRVSELHPGDADVDIQQKDVLPSIGFEFTPLDSLTFRASYSETIARQTFKELTPIQQMEYLGGDVFIGNPNLQMSSLKNYDLRVDYAPYAGSLISFSWFYKDITDPIEYTQRNATNVGTYTTPVNYPEGEIKGYEVEIRQQLGRFWNALEGLTVGANATFIDSEVTISKADQSQLEGFGFPESKRDMMNAPEYLYNLNLTYDIEKTGTRLGLFYTVQGDTLVTGAGSSGGGYAPAVYAKKYGTLNFSLSQKIGENWTLGFKAKNLTNPKIKTVYRSDYLDGDTTKTSYTKGIEYSISASYEF
jgi:outer membrane receptor protein involved in Fe transport